MAPRQKCHAMHEGVKCNVNAQYKYSEKGRGTKRACSQVCRDRLGITGPLNLSASQTCHCGCGAPAQTVVDAAGNRYANQKCLPAGAEALVLGCAQCHCGCKQAAQKVLDAAGNRYANQKCLPAGEQFVVPAWAQCHCGCGAPSRAEVQDAAGNHYAKMACLPAGEEAVVAAWAACACGCKQRARDVLDAAGNQYANQKCLPAGAEFVVPARAQCHCGCGAPARGELLDAAGNRYANKKCLPAGEEAVVAAWAACIAGCNRRKRIGWFGNLYCGEICVPEAMLLVRSDAIYKRFGTAVREVTVSRDIRKSYSVLLLPRVQAVLDVGSSVGVFATSVSIDVTPADAMAAVWEEVWRIFGRDSAVMVKPTGETWSSEELLAGGVTAHLLACSRTTIATGGQGMETDLHEALAALQRSSRLWTTTSGNGPSAGPTKVLMLCLMEVPAAFRERSRITTSPLQAQYDAKNARLAASWKLSAPPHAVAAARVAAFEAANPGRTPFIAVPGQSVQDTFQLFQQMEERFQLLSGSPTAVPAPPPDIWDGKLKHAKLLFTGCRVDDVEGLAERLAKAGATVVTAGTHTLLVYKDQFKQHGKLGRAMTLGSCTQFISLQAFLTRLYGASGSDFGCGVSSGGSGGLGGDGWTAAGLAAAEPQSGARKRRFDGHDDDDE